MAANPHHHMSVEEYLALDRSDQETKYEYIDGAVYHLHDPQALTGGSAAHSWISINTVLLLQKYLQHGPCRVFNSDMRVKINATRYTYPDISVSCAEADLREDIDIIHAPRLIIEILSPSTEAYDRGKNSLTIRALQPYKNIC